MPQTGKQANSTHKPVTKCPKNISEAGYKYVFNCKEHSKKKNELNIMVEDINPHIIGITESWASEDIADPELRLTGNVMFRRDRIGRREGESFYKLKNLFRLTK